MDQPLLNALCESVDGAGLMRHVGAFAQRVTVRLHRRSDVRSR